MEASINTSATAFDGVIDHFKSCVEVFIVSYIIKMWALSDIFIGFNSVFNGTPWILVASSFLHERQPHIVSDRINPTGIRTHAWVHCCTAQYWTAAR